MHAIDDVTARARALLARIAAHDGELHCYVAVDEAAVLREAARLDALPAAARGPLHGRALAVKDMIDVAGLPTRAGSSFFRRDPARDAPVVAALRAAGALVVGKSNTHEFAWGITTVNPHFGRTANPWDPARIAGGSSGGSAAAVAAGLADVALGGDTLGSIRIPAALTGLSGLRPATGALSLEGAVPLALGLDTIGPLAPDLATVQQLYEVLAGRPLAAPGPRRVCRLRGGVWEAVEPSVTSALDAAAAALRAGGIAVDEVAWSDDGLADAVMTLQQYAAQPMHAPLFAAHAEQYGSDVRPRVAAALAVSAQDERAARAVAARARASWDAATAGYDVALVPAVGCEAPLVPVPPTFRDHTIPLTAPVSVFGFPSASVPVGFGPAGLPLGMGIIALDGDPAGALAVGRRFQQLTDWHQRRAPLAGANGGAA